MKTFLLKKINQNQNKYYDVIFLYILIIIVEFLFFNIFTLFLSILIISLYTTFKMDKKVITFSYLSGINFMIFYVLIILINLYQVNNFNDEHLYKKNSQMFFKENFYITKDKEIFVLKNNEKTLLKILDLKTKEDSDLYYKYLTEKDLNLVVEKRTFQFNFGFYLREKTYFNLI